jgi:hypothetical protein
MSETSGRRLRWLVIAALATTVAAVAAGTHPTPPSAAGEAEPPAAGAADAAKAAQTPAEADAALERLLKAGRPPASAARRSLANAPKFVATPRKDKIGKYPCTSCHDNSFVDRRVRPLVEEHKDLAFDHGGGRFWCYESCHNGRDMDWLVSLKGRQIDYDASYKVCGQCHAQREKDWRFGGHGKRVGAWNAARDVPLTAAELLVLERDRIGTWRGPRTILNCVECHDPHSPSIQPFKPSPPPGPRPGVSIKSTTPASEPRIWERLGTERKAH